MIDKSTYGVIIINTLGNNYSDKMFEAARDACEKDGRYFYVTGEQEDLVCSTPQVIISSKYCLGALYVHGTMMPAYDALVKHAAERDVREEVHEAMRLCATVLRVSNAQVSNLCDNAKWIYACNGVTPYFVDTDPRVILFNQISLLEVPEKIIPGTGHKATYTTIDRGGVLGRGLPAREPEQMVEALKDADPYLGHEIASYIMAKRHTEDKGTPGDLTLPENEGVVFVPLHCTWDAQMISYGGLFGRNYDLLKTVLDNVPEGWVVVAKPHPFGDKGLLGAADPVIKLAEDRPNCVLSEHSIHDILPLVDVVVTLNSSVGMEALCYDLPIIVAGEAMYQNIHGVTWKPRNLGELIIMLRNVDTLGAPDDDVCPRAIAFFWGTYLMVRDNKHALETRCRVLIAEAINLRHKS